jgi:NAD(P)-dependent dehydrogenase (short-subunit alcohol dehydrogenase family)
MAQPPLAGRTVVITGGSRGIGRMLAEGLAARGVRIEIAGRSEGPLAETVAAIGEDRCAATATDLRTEEGISTLVDAVASRHDRVDGLINNAATSRFTPLDGEHSMAQWDRLLRLNVTVPFLLTVRLLPLLAAGWAADGRRGHVINIGSIDGLRPPEHDAYAYAVSKAALHHLTQVLAPRLAPRGVLVNALAPSAFLTTMSTAHLGDRLQQSAAMNPMGRLGEPADIVGAAAFLLSDDSAFVNGAIIPVDGGVRNRTIPLDAMARHLDLEQFLRVVRPQPRDGKGA